MAGIITEHDTGNQKHNHIFKNYKRPTWLFTGSEEEPGWRRPPNLRNCRIRLGGPHPRSLGRARSIGGHLRRSLVHRIRVRLAGGRRRLGERVLQSRRSAIPVRIPVLGSVSRESGAKLGSRPGSGLIGDPLGSGNVLVGPWRAALSGESARLRHRRARGGNRQRERLVLTTLLCWRQGGHLPVGKYSIRTVLLRIPVVVLLAFLIAKVVGGSVVQTQRSGRPRIQ